MISETTFSKRFTSFWNEILPNSKNYIRLINGGLIEALYEPFEAAERKQNTALVNVLSFDILRALCNKNVLIGEVSSPNFFNGDLFTALLDQGLNYLSKFSYGKDCDLPLSNREKEQIRQLFQMMYNRYVAGNSSIEVDPSFDGCGFINMSYGDLISNHTLVEIKSGERSFSVTDIRQVLVYLTLNHYSLSPYQIDYIELFNPRMGISFSEDVEGFCKNISALNSQELFSEVQKFVVDNNFVEVFGT